MWSDFTGFTFDGVHSDELNILRVSDGDRYEEVLLPDFEDKTVETSGRDGVYYYGSFYQSRNIDIQIAFDSVTEEQYRNIRRLFGQKKICKLIFDERPYKVYYVKIAEPITLETICFDEPDYYWDTTGHIPKRDALDDIIEETTEESSSDSSNEEENIDNENENNTSGESIGTYIPGSINHKVYTGGRRRIYKGEGSISFIAYDPFARQLYKTLDQYTVNGYDNVDEWDASSGILTAEEYNTGAYDIYQENINDVRFLEKYNGQINVYNPGDIDTPYYLFIPYVNNRIDPDLTKGENVIIATDGMPDLIIEPFERKSGAVDENGILINTRAELIEGVQYNYISKTWRVTGNLYNRYIKRGSFGRIFKGNKFDFRHQGIYLNCAVSTQKPEIFYNYLYY